MARWTIVLANHFHAKLLKGEQKPISTYILYVIMKLDTIKVEGIDNNFVISFDGYYDVKHVNLRELSFDFKNRWESIKV